MNEKTAASQESCSIPLCDKCGKIQTELGGLEFGPPRIVFDRYGHRLKGQWCNKLHVCVKCSTSNNQKENRNIELMKTLSEKRAIKIVELQEELEEAKKIIGEFVWPPDATVKQQRAFKIKAAHFSGAPIPHYTAENEEENEQQS